MLLLENNELTVQIDTVGGRLHSIRTKANSLEYLWQGSKFPNLFPFVGRLYQKQYTLNGVHYPMQMHGFLRNMEMEVVAQEESSCVLQLTDNPETMEAYPYTFVFRISYQLEGRRIQIGFQIENRSRLPLFCAMGGHPGFRVPLEEGLAFEDYALTFPVPCQPEQIEFSDSVLTLQSCVPFPLEENIRIPLRHSLFEKDAVVLKGTPGQVTISSRKGSHGVQVDYPRMPYVGFWQYNQREPPFVCIEPWSALPGRQDVVEDLSNMPDITRIEAGESFCNPWSITVW